MHRHLLIVVVVVQSILAQQEDIDWAFLVSLLSVSLAFKVPTNQMLAQMYVTVVHLTHTKTKLAVLLVKSVGVLRRVVGQVGEVLLHVLVVVIQSIVVLARSTAPLILPMHALLVQ